MKRPGTRWGPAWAWAFLALVPVIPVSAQLDPPYEVMAGAPIVDEQGRVLAGGGTNRSGCLVQILSAGANQTVDTPDAQGRPGGDDVVLYRTQVGAGMAPNLERSGRFAVSFHPPPRAGSRVFVRVFNHAEAEQATQYGDSRPAEVVALEVLDVSVQGLHRTDQPLPQDG